LLPHDLPSQSADDVALLGPIKLIVEPKRWIMEYLQLLNITDNDVVWFDGGKKRYDDLRSVSLARDGPKRTLGCGCIGDSYQIALIACVADCG